MPAGALFGSSSSGPGSTGGIKHLVEMRAGKMNLKGRTVYPDKRKGLLYVYQSEDSLMHFCWQDRTSGAVEDDLIIFPDDCEYVKVPQCTTGRVYLLKFKSSNRKFFFWLQEPRADKDEENCKRINEYLNNPSSTVQSAGNTDQDLHSLLNNMSQSQLMQLFGGGQMGGLSSLLGTISRPPGSNRASATAPAITHRTTIPSTPITTAASQGSTPSTPQNTTAAAAATTTTTPTTTAAAAATAATVPDAPVKATRSTTQRSSEATPPTANNPIQLADLQNFLQGLSPNATGNQQSVDLSTALTSEALSGLLTNSEALEQLQGHLPAVDGNVQEQLRSTLASPQFQQAVSQFSSALESGQLAPIVSQLAINPDAVSAAAQGNMQEFVKALEKGGEGKDDKPSEKPKEKDNDEKKDDDEGMQLD